MHKKLEEYIESLCKGCIHYGDCSIECSRIMYSRKGFEDGYIIAQSEVNKCVIPDVSKSVCLHCGYTYDTHSEVGKLCPDRMKHFETVC